MNSKKFYFIRLFILLVIISFFACNEDNSTEPEPQIIVPDISVSVDAFPKFTCAGQEINFIIEEISDESEAEHISLTFDIDGDGVFEESSSDSTGWNLAVEQMGVYDAKVIINYDDVPFDTSIIKLEIASPPDYILSAQNGIFWEFTWSWDSRKFVVVYTGHQPYIFDVDEYVFHAFPFQHFQGCRHNAVISPDNKFLAYGTAGADIGIDYYDIENGEETILFNDTDYKYQPSAIAWSPLGDKIAFSTSASEIYLLSFPEGEISKLDEEAAICGWSHDGKKLLLSEEATSTIERIKIYNLENKTVTNTFEVELNESPGHHAERLYWIKDTNWIYSSVSRRLINTITGESKKIILPFGGNDGWMDLEYSNQVQISPDGRLVAFKTYNSEMERIEMHLSMLPVEIYE